MKRKFTKLSPLEKAKVLERWYIREDRDKLYIDENGVPLLKTEIGYILVGSVREDSLICGGFHNREKRLN